MEVILLGSTEEENGGLRSGYTNLLAQMKEMTFWFRVGGVSMSVYLLLFGPSQAQKLIEMIARAVR